MAGAENSWRRYNVSQGVLVHNQRVLLVGTDYGYAGGLTWALPGGRLEAGEPHDAALVREFLEETGLAIAVEDLLYVADSRSAKEHKHFVTCAFKVCLLNPPTDHSDPPVSCENDASVRDVRFVSFAEAAALIQRPSLGAALLDYLYYGADKMTRRYWLCDEYLPEIWQPLQWPPLQPQ